MDITKRDSIHDRDKNSTVLLVLCTPSRASVRFEEELRAVDNAIAESRNRDQVELRSSLATRPADLHSAFLRYEPAIVHFIGHCTDRNRMVFSGERGSPWPVPEGALSDFFRVVNNTVKCVVLNACHTLRDGRAIAQHVPSVICANGELLDAAAVLFSVGFYRALASGQTISTAYGLGRNAVWFRYGDKALEQSPVLISQPGMADALRLTRIRRRSSPRS